MLQKNSPLIQKHFKNNQNSSISQNQEIVSDTQSSRNSANILNVFYIKCYKFLRHQKYGERHKKFSEFTSKIDSFFSTEIT